MFSFRISHKDSNTRGRAGLLTTPRGQIKTPVFMPVGTAGTVKAVPHEFLENMNIPIILGNTYHLYLRPGTEIISRFGGLHNFISWPKPILTDSGGFQVFSHRKLRKLNEEGVAFKSHLDGSSHFLSPEKSIEIQQVLGSDIIMAFDECTPFPVSRQEAEDSMQLSVRWAERCRSAWTNRDSQSLFGIIQGGMFVDLRKQCIERIEELDLPGIALGGFSVGEPKNIMYEILEEVNGYLPPEKPHYLMGVGTPLDIMLSVMQGIDMFDCVLPTRNARNGMLFTWNGPVRIKNSIHSMDDSPLDPDCSCPVCSRYSRAYLRHLFISGEILSYTLNSLHNLYFYSDLMKKIRENIKAGTLKEFSKIILESYREED
jgi:queuine tRNA-ribosyltransferase